MEKLTMKEGVKRKKEDILVIYLFYLLLFIFYLNAVERARKRAAFTGFCGLAPGPKGGGA
jgi:hypothetical protein